MFGWQRHSSIPAFLSVDVEPDGFQLPRANPPMWPGYSAMFEIVEKLRSNLIACSGSAPKFGWYFRTDPQIAEVYGAATSALFEFPGRLAHLKAKGDYFGVHVHPIRWGENEGAWVHDVEDTEWTAHCTRFALDAFAQWQGSPAQRFRAGAGYLSNALIDVIERHDVKVDLSLEPVKGWWLYCSEVQTAIDSSPLIGKYTESDTAPRTAYRPARHDFRLAENRNGRDLILLPCTTSAPSDTASWRDVFRWKAEPARYDAQMLYPSVEWPSPRDFWDLAERRLRSMRKPYLSLAIRTDAADSLLFTRVQQILEELPRHPLAERLNFTDPIDAAPRLL